MDALLIHWLVYKSEHLRKQCSKRKWKLPVRLGLSLEKCIAPLLLLVRQPQSSDFKVREDGPQALDGRGGVRESEAMFSNCLSEVWLVERAGVGRVSG